MKTIQNNFSLTALAVLSFTFFSCNAQKRNITVKELPATAQTFVKAHFPNQATSYIVEDKELTKTEYEVHFTGGAEVEFDGSGNWKEIDMNRNLMPNGILHKSIAAYIAQNYKGQQVEKVEKKRYGFKVEFLSDLELEFDHNGNFLKIDD